LITSAVVLVGASGIALAALDAASKPVKRAAATKIFMGVIPILKSANAAVIP
jgi:hypothetical protein